jgi:hypothetical protein
MLLPLIGFAVGCVVFTVVGSIVLGYFAGLPLTRTNLLVFVIGAFPGAAGLGYLHELIFADAKHELHSIAAVLVYVAVMLIGAILGGTTLVWLKVLLTGRLGRSQSF